MHWRGIIVSDELIREKGRRLLNNYNESVSNDVEVKLNFRNGCIARFKERNGFRRHKSHGEQADANQAAYYANLPFLREVLRTYSHHGVWNCDEFGLYYRMVPITTVRPRKLVGNKKTRQESLCLPVRMRAV